MIDTLPWSSCSRRSPWPPWLPCSSHTFSSAGPSVSPFRDFLYGNCKFCHQYARGYNFPIQTTPKKILFPSYGSFFGLTSVFGHSPITTISYLNLTVFNKTWWKRPGQQKNESKWQRTQSRPDYGETAFFLAKNAFYPKKQPKMHFIPKNGQNFLRDWY